MPRVRSATTESEEILLDNFTVVNTFSNFSSYSKLEAVIDHLYDSVFVYFNEGTKKDVLQLLWTTIPNDVSTEMHNRNDKWSRACILEAFRKVSHRDSNIIHSALNNLKNCRNAPYIAEDVTNFIQIYEDQFSGNNILKNFPSNKRKTRNHNQKRLESIDVELKRSGFSLGTCYTPVIAVLAIVIIVTIFLYFVDKVNTKLNAVAQDKEYLDTFQTNQSYTKTTQVTYWSSELSENQPTYKFIQMSSPLITTFFVKSYMEYKTVISDIIAVVDVDLTLAIENTQHWPDIAVLNKTDNIVNLHIMGAVSTLAIFNILSSMSNIKKLKITNSFNSPLCGSEQNDGHFQGKTIQLQSLKEMHFDSFPECISFYKLVVKHTCIKNLNTFRLSKSQVTQNNYVVIQKILKKSRDSIESLQFPDTMWNAPLFDYRISTLHNLHSIHIDFMNNTSAQTNFSISRFIDTFFPNLKSFTSTYGYLPINTFQNLSECKKLSKLKVKLVIPENQTSIDLSTMTKIFPLVQQAELYFKFESWENKNSCQLNGSKEIKAHVNNLLLTSNCPNVI